MKTIKNKIAALVVMIAIAASAAIAAPKTTDQDGAATKTVSSEVLHQLRKLPRTGIFDNLAYKVEGSTVTLYGQVMQPSTRKDAESRVKRIEGVEQVVNNIEVLPLSSFDNGIRRGIYRELLRTGGLYRYTRGTQPSLRIIVRGGHVTLEGVVSTKTDKQLAYIAASRVPGVFSVTNNLRAERGEAY
ncbi:MAG: BON domain-containing protein [Pyrinomonadaceae bacterium]